MSSSRTKNSVKNVMAGFLCQGITLLLNFVSRSFFVSVLSSEYLGINGLFSNILTILSFAELGIGEALSFAMYQPARENNKKKLCELLRLYKLAYRGIAIFVSVIGIVLSFFLDYLVADKPDIPENFQIIFWLFLFNNVCSYLLAYKQAILLVDQKKYIILYVQQGIKIFQIIVQISVLVLIKSYYAFLLVQVLCTGLSNIMVSAYVAKHYPWLNEKNANGKVSREERNKILDDIKALSISKIAGVVSNGSDNIVIAKILGLTSVGVISNYTMVINSISTILWGALSGVIGSLGNFNASAGTKERENLFDELYLMIYWIYTLCCSCLVAILNPFVEVWLGNEYSVDIYVVVALVLIAYISGINIPVYTFRVTCGLFNEMKWPYFLSGIANIILSIIFAFKMGLFGVYFATIISRVIICEMAEGYIVYKNILHKPFYKYIIRYLMGMVLLGICVSLCSAASESIELSGLVGLILKAIVSFVLCNLMLMVSLSWRKEFKRLLLRGKKLMGKVSL